MGAPGQNARAGDLRLLTAALLLAAALAPALISLKPGREPGPPPLDAPRVVYRPDGGQAALPTGSLKPNILTELNLGRSIDLISAAPGHLAALPGLGSKSADNARQSGCLPARAGKTLNGLVKETCDRNKP